MAGLKLKKGDLVKVTAGKFKGEVGKVVAVLYATLWIKHIWFYVSLNNVKPFNFYSVLFR